jgi:hypothetical protein
MSADVLPPSVLAMEIPVRQWIHSSRSEHAPVTLSAAGLALGAAGVIVQAAAGADLPRPIPPGVVILTVAAALVVAVRSRWMPIGISVVAVFSLLNVDDRGGDSLLGGAGIGIAVGKWMLLVGALSALVGALAMLGHARRRTRESAGTIAGASMTENSGREWPRRLQVAGLLVLAPVCAEYLTAYDSSTGDLLVLVGGLIIFVPLYGAPALLIREVARRCDLGWPGILLLSAAFGLTQAGLVDQSLFSLDYRQIESWDETLRATLVDPLGLSAANAMNFIGGHIIYSICAPIALIEAFRPHRSREPWISRRVLGVVAGLYIAASALVLQDHLTTESSHASIAQLSGSAAVLALLILAAFAVSRRHTARRSGTDSNPLVSSDPRNSSAGGERPVPSARTTFLLALLAALIHSAATTWTGVAVAVVVLVLGGALVKYFSGSPKWNGQHIVALAAAAVFVRAALAFSYFPVIGDVSAVPKYTHNAVLLIAIVVISALAFRHATVGQKTRDRTGARR